MLKFCNFCVMIAAVVLNLISKVIHTADSIFGLYWSLFLIITVHWQNPKIDSGSTSTEPLSIFFFFIFI